MGSNETFLLTPSLFNQKRTWNLNFSVSQENLVANQQQRQFKREKLYKSPLMANFGPKIRFLLQ